MKDQIKGKEDRMKNEYDRFRSVDPYSPKTPTGAGSQAIAPTQSAAVGSPRGAEAEKSAPGDERAAETAQENEQERAQALAQEVELRRAQAASLRELRRMGGKGGRLSKDNKQKVAAQGRSVAGFISEEAQNSDWPYLLVLALSIINDLVDIFDVNLGLGLDQLFDFACLALMLGARLFIKQHEIGWMAWVASKLFTMLVEWIPVVGIIPTWTISALYVLSYARRQRKKRQRQGAMMEMEYAAMTEEEALASEEAEEEYRVAV
ncbi:MAG: hypothetical protein Q7S23_02080 [bacterium]|nr:hypothetical protein [bacterium]